MKYSFSAERCVRRCQRQFYFRDIAAWHNAKDPLRREAFVLKQLKTIELWRGLLVHTGIEKFVVPSLQSGGPVDWEDVIERTTEMARRQLAFSAAKRYRQKGLSKKGAGDDFCALLPHELGEEISAEEFEGVVGGVRSAFTNLANLDQLWSGLRGVRKFFPELTLVSDYEGARVEGHVDLMYFRGFGRPTIIDWKVYEGSSGSDGAYQTALYAWLLCRSPRWRVSRPEDVELIEVRLLDSEVVRHKFDEAALEALEDRLYRGIDEVRSLTGGLKFEELDLSDFAYANSPGTCALCPFRPLCLGEGVPRALSFAELV